MTRAMIALILTLSLAVRAVVCAIGAVASVAKGAGDGRLEAVRARPVAFPCYFPAKPLAGKIFSLLARSGKLAQRIDLTEKYRSERAGFQGQKQKTSLLFPGWQGKSRGQNMPSPMIPSTRSSPATTRLPITPRRISLVPPPNVP